MSFTKIKEKDMHKYNTGITSFNGIHKEFEVLTTSGIQNTIKYRDYFHSSIAVNFSSYIDKNGMYEIIHVLNGLNLLGYRSRVKLRLKDFKAINTIMEGIFKGTHDTYDYKRREYISELSEKRNLFLLNIYNYKKLNGLKIEQSLIDHLSNEMMI
jgi:hypothetical protein